MRRFVVACCTLLLVLSVLPACSTFDRMTGREETPKQKTDAPNQAFYGFPDIPIPKELAYAPNKSFVYETQLVKVGVLVLSGNVELQSLEDYFKVNMVKNGWRFVNNFRFRGEVAMNFAKEDRTANIRMSKDTFSADVEIWVGPTNASLEKPSMQKGADGPTR